MRLLDRVLKVRDLSGRVARVESKAGRVAADLCSSALLLLHTSVGAGCHPTGRRLSIDTALDADGSLDGNRFLRSLDWML